MVFHSVAGQQHNPLSKYPIFQSNDIEEAHDLISQNFSPHSLNILSGQKSLTTQYDGLFFNKMALLCGTYGADVLVNLMWFLPRPTIGCNYVREAVV